MCTERKDPIVYVFMMGRMKGGRSYRSTTYFQIELLTHIELEELSLRKLVKYVSLPFCKNRTSVSFNFQEMEHQFQCQAYSRGFQECANLQFRPQVTLALWFKCTFSNGFAINSNALQVLRKDHSEPYQDNKFYDFGSDRELAAVIVRITHPSQLQDYISWKQTQ